jgi:uncharacterized phage protein (TIGR01671 family)
MKNYKFRGKRVETWNNIGKIGEWIYGYYIVEDGCHLILNNPDNKSRLLAHIVDPDTVGMYIGLKDKDGEEIYEGDIVRYANEFGGENIGIVVHTGYLCYIQILGLHKKHNYLNLYLKNNSANRIKIIGNRFDNPELMKE